MADPDPEQDLESKRGITCGNRKESTEIPVHKSVQLGVGSGKVLLYIQAYAEELKEAGIDTGDVSPLLLPKYARHER